MGRALPLSSYLARFITSANLSQLRTFANMISSMSEAVATGMGWAASGYSPVKTPCKVAMVLLKLVVLPLTAPSWQQINPIQHNGGIDKANCACCLQHKHARSVLCRLLQDWRFVCRRSHMLLWCTDSSKVMQIMGDSVQPTSYWAGKKLRSCT